MKQGRGLLGAASGEIAGASSKLPREGRQGMASERLYIVAYDIADRKRWQKVFKTMKGYGHWLQLSVFQCRLTARRRVEMTQCLEGAIKPSEDHVLILDLGPAGQVEPRVESLGRSYEALERKVTIV